MTTFTKKGNQTVSDLTSHFLKLFFPKLFTRCHLLFLLSLNYFSPNYLQDATYSFFFPFRSYKREALRQLSAKKLENGKAMCKPTLPAASPHWVIKSKNAKISHRSKVSRLLILAYFKISKCKKMQINKHPIEEFSRA